MAIKSFQHKGLERFFSTGSRAGIQASHANKLGRLLTALNEAAGPQDMNLPGWGLHGLTGDLSGQYLVKVNGNWRLTFKFEGTEAVLVNYQDYH